MRRSLLETLESRRLLAYVMPAFADQIGITNLVDPNTTFEDNFDGTSLDRNKWQVREGPRWRKVRNGPIDEMSVTGEESIVVRNGNLELIAHTDPATGQNRAGYIQTGSDFKANHPSNVEAARLMDGYNGEFEQAFGYWESRVKFSTMPGQWSAFWVHSYGMVDVGDDPSRINRPDLYGTEYDVAEHGAIRQGANASHQISTVVHANGYEEYQRSHAVHPTTANYGPSYTSPDAFHVYGLLWTATSVKFYIDGNLVHTQTDPALVSKVAHVAIFSNDIGAGGALFPDQGSNFFGNVPANGYGSLETSNAKLTADYIRVWKFKTNGPTPTPSEGSLAGSVYNDANANGWRDGNEAGVSGRTIYLDKNWNGLLDGDERSTQSNADGDYLLTNITPGTYLVRQVLTSGTQTTPSSTTAATVNISANQQSTLHFGIGGLNPVAGNVVEGRVILDTNGNGIINTGEGGAANINVYLDYDLDGLRDADEPQATTNSNGDYRLTGDRSGSVAIRLNLNTLTHEQTLPVVTAARWVTLGTTVAAAGPFAVRSLVVAPTYATITGTVYTDANRNTRRDSNEAGRANVAVYLDLNLNGRRDTNEPSTTTASDGTYRLEQLTAGSRALRIVLPGNTTQSAPINDGTHWLTLVAGTTYADKHFGLYDNVVAPSYATITGTVYTDTNRNGRRDSNEAGRANVVVYLDLNLNGRRDANEPSATTASNGTYRFDQVTAGTKALRVVVPTGTTQSAPTGDGAHWINAVVGNTYADKLFGLYESVTGGRITGTVYLDANANGRRDANETGAANISVYLDRNFNGRRDANETLVMTSSTGAYVFEQVAAGNVAVRVALSSDYRQITPTANNAHWLTISNGSNFADKLFGIARVASPAATNTITGSVFGDWNANGRRDNGENGLSGFKVYLDYNLNGKYDAGEPLSVTNASGVYHFNAVRAGNLAIRLNLVGIGWLQTYPTNNGGYWHNFTSGSNLKDQHFLVKPK